MDDTFLGLPIEYVWIPILIGIIIGALFPLRLFMRSKLHFSINPNDSRMLREDAAALSKIIPEQGKDQLIGFCRVLRKLGLTLYIK